MKVTRHRKTPDIVNGSTPTPPPPPQKYRPVFGGINEAANEPAPVVVFEKVTRKTRRRDKRAHPPTIPTPSAAAETRPAVTVPLPTEATATATATSRSGRPIRQKIVTMLFMTVSLGAGWTGHMVYANPALLPPVVRDMIP